MRHDHTRNLAFTPRISRAFAFVTFFTIIFISGALAFSGFEASAEAFTAPPQSPYTSDLSASSSIALKFDRSIFSSLLTTQSPILRAAQIDRFRLSDLDLRDPHVVTDVPIVGCLDITDTQIAGFSINAQIQTEIQADSDDDDLLDASYVLEFEPFDTTGSTMPISFGMADCTEPIATTLCGPFVGQAVESVATASSTGPCMEPIAGSLRPYTPAVVSAAAPCFGANLGDVNLILLDMPLTLRDTSIGATFSGTPPEAFSNGLLRGFLTEADANSITIPDDLPIIGGKVLSSVLPGGASNCVAHSDKDLNNDTTGWWFYFNFPANRVPTEPSAPTSLVVNQNHDSGDGTCDGTCTLRDAVTAANNNPADDTIEFAEGLTTVSLSNEIVLAGTTNGSITINGHGENVLTINGGVGSNRIFSTSGTVTLNGMTLTGGNGGGAAHTGMGGAIYASAGSLHLNRVKLMQNVASGGHGGAIYNDGRSGSSSLTINDSAISANTASAIGSAEAGNAGGIYNDGSSGSATLTVINSVINDNISELGPWGGDLHSAGIFNNGAGGNAAITIRNSTLTGNQNGEGIFNAATTALSTSITITNSTITDSLYSRSESSGTTSITIGNSIMFTMSISGTSTTVNSLGYNLCRFNGGGFLTATGDIINVDPLLGPLQDNGGLTLTRALQTGSQAIDSGDPGFVPPPDNDQRGTGFQRVSDGNNDGTARLDIGAFEVQGVGSPTPTPTVTPTPTPEPSPTASPTPGCGWSPSTAYPTSTALPAGAVQGNFLYSFGGLRDDLEAPTVNSYRFDGTTWTSIAPLPEARFAAVAVSDGTYIYILGGANRDSMLVATGFRYDPASNSYTEMENVTPRAFHSAAYQSGKIHVWGGTLDGVGPASSSHDVFTISNGSWTNGAAVPVPAVYASSFVHGGYIYSVGGAADYVTAVPMSTALRYDPVANSWDNAAMADLPQPRMAAIGSTGIFNGGLALVGGSDATAISWDPSTNSWDPLPSTSIVHSGGVGGVINNIFYVGSGSTTEKLACTGGPSQTPTPTPVPTATPQPTPDVTIDFGDQGVGTTSVTKSVTFLNGAEEDLVIGTPTFADGSQFDLVSDPNGTVVPPNGEITFEFTFTPTSLGPKSDTVTINVLFGGESVPVAIVGLTGNGVTATPTPTPTATPEPTPTPEPNATIDFGNQNVGTTSASKSITFINGPEGDLVIGTPTFADGSQFDLVSDPNGTVVPPNGEITFEFTFTPTSAGPKSDTVTINILVGNEPVPGAYVGLSGVGVDVTPTPAAELDFGDQTVNTTSASQSVTFFNTFEEDITFGTPTFEDGSQFDLVADPNGTVVPPNGEITLEFTFTPTSNGPKSDLVTVTLLIGGEPVPAATIGLTGNGIGGAPTPTPTPQPQCSDGIDNDGDGFIDYPDDFGCTSADDNDEGSATPTPQPACSDGIDNDGDGFIDYPNDFGCTSADDDDEGSPTPTPTPQPQCSDGIDNDGDGFIDYPDDFGCTSADDDDEISPTPTPTPNTEREVRFIGGSTVPGNSVSSVVDLVSLGDENSVGFSLEYDGTLLNTPQVELAQGLPSGTSLFVNTATPNIGVIVALPPGQAFSAGTHQVVTVTFSTVPTDDHNTPVDFVDAPVLRSVANANADSLPAKWTNGLITFSQGYEGDLVDRPIGNGAVTVADLTMAGSMLVGNVMLDPAYNEFQRLDTAPRAQFGDGVLSVADFTQIGRYAAAIDPSVVAGGPGTPSITSLWSSAKSPVSSMFATAAATSVSAVGGEAGRGSQVTVSINAAAQGIENGFGFTVEYDPAILLSPVVQLGPNVPAGTSFFPNTNTSGSIGVIMARGTDQTFPAGILQLVTITFTIASTAPAGPTPVTLTSSPVVREISDVNANGVESQWIDGYVAILAPTAAGASVSGRVLTNNGVPIRGAVVTVLDANGTQRAFATNTFGYYRFDDLQVGHAYIVSVSARRYQFTPSTMVLDLADSVEELNFIGTQ